VETAEIIGSILKCEVEIMEQLNEQNIYGAYPELSANQPEEEYRRLGELIADRNIQLQDVETYQNLKERVAASLSKITDRSYQCVAIITHGGPIRSIVRDILKRGELTNMSNGTIIELEKIGSHLEIVGIEGAVLQ
jgi:broad specificity phosphatase PhoE